MNWNDLRYILAISREGSFSAAATSLGVDDTTVSRRLAALQSPMGTRLCYRLKNGGLQFTEAGEMAVRLAETIEREIGELISHDPGPDDQVSGSVRLTSVPFVVNRILIPASALLSARHPALRVELIANARDFSLTRREADLAIRLARPKTGGTQIIARRIGYLDYRIYIRASHDRNDKCRLPWIVYDDTMLHLPQARWLAGRVKNGEAAANIRVNDVESAFEAAVAGLGRTLLPSFIADGDKRLRRHLNPPSDPVVSRELWLLSHKEHRNLKSIDAVIDWIGQALRG